MSKISVRAFVKDLATEPDSADLTLHQHNCSPELITERLHQLVPLLEFVGCKVEEVGESKTVLSLPLLATAMNQNGTHQAAIFYLVADYTLGVGMFGVLPGVYVTGVHDRCNALPVQYWLKQGLVRHWSPGTGSLRTEVCISPEKARKLRQQLVERGRGEMTDTVRFYQNGHLVAEAEHIMGIYADMPRIPGVRANIFQVQNLKTSALMISGLRDDDLSQTLAESQGRAIAHRMTLATPQLPSLVNARTLHLETQLQSRCATYPQVLVLAVGLDPKPARLSTNDQRWFGIDLREMLREREMRFSRAGISCSNFTPVAADLRLDTWDQSLLDTGFDPSLPTFVIIEGLSMYLTTEELAKLFGKIRLLAQSPLSRLWIDHVTSGLFELESVDVKAFLSSMTRLGEPFVNGFDDASSIHPTWVTEASATAADVMRHDDAVHHEYQFSILRPSQMA